MKRFVLFLIYTVFCGFLFAEPVDSIWQKANSNYTSGNFAEAAELYEQILKTGEVSSDLYFNLGNAYFKQNMNAEARLNYERALRLDPQNEDILYNIRYVKVFQSDKIDEIEEMFLSKWVDNILNAFTSTQWAVAFIGLFFLMLVLILVYLFTNKYTLRKISFISSVAIVVLLLFTFLMGIRQRNQQLDRSEGIIFSSVITVKASPDASGSDLFIIHEGLKVKIIGEQGSWIRIKLTDGKSQGWIPKESLKRI